MTDRSKNLARILAEQAQAGFREAIGDRPGNEDLLLAIEEIARDAAEAMGTPEEWDDQALEDQARLVLQRRADRAGAAAKKTALALVKTAIDVAVTSAEGQQKTSAEGQQKSRIEEYRRLVSRMSELYDQGREDEGDALADGLDDLWSQLTDDEHAELSRGITQERIMPNLPPGAPSPDRGLLGTSPRTSRAGLTQGIALWLIAILRVAYAVHHGQELSWPAIEAAAIAIAGLAAFAAGRRARDNTTTSREAGAE